MARVIIQEQKCKGCGLCVWACPNKVLSLDNSKLNTKGYSPVTVVDMNACIGCCACAIMCPDCVIEVEK